MDGVTILASEVVNESYFDDLKKLLFIFSFFALFAGFEAFYLKMYKECKRYFSFIGFFVLIFVVLCFIPHKYTEYGVVIDKNKTSIEDFNEKYQILEQKGSIYIVRERKK